MKRGFVNKLLIFISFVFLISVVSATNVAYLSKDLSKVDGKVLEIFEDEGFDVDIILDKEIMSKNFSGYDFVYIPDMMFKNIKHLDMNVPMIISNHYHGNLLGIIIHGEASRVAANSPLYVLVDGEKVPVYTAAKNNGKGIQYYYLSEKKKNSNLIQIASTFKKISSNGFGDVVAVSENGNKCFFGITETKYWTEEAEDLFEECISRVLNRELPEDDGDDDSGNDDDGDDSGNDDETPQEDLIHNIVIQSTLSSSVNGIRIRDNEAAAFLTDEMAMLTCNKSYTVSFSTINNGNFTEDINFIGKITHIGDMTTVFNWSAFRDNLPPRNTTTTGSKTFTTTFANGDYSISIFADIAPIVDSVPEDNLKSRNVKVVCS